MHSFHVKIKNAKVYCSFISQQEFNFIGVRFVFGHFFQYFTSLKLENPMLFCFFNCN